MKVDYVIRQLKQLNPKAECVFAEYTDKGQTELWHLNICCNTEYQAEVKQVWFGRNMRVE